MSASPHKLCPKCRKPMSFALPPGGKGTRAMRCMDCDGPDPLKSGDAGWVNSSLKPPRK
ncbi:hypothetical protein [Bradyrhizobium sp.]|uniref:hypothetical protein n=1 Tax=Bradyrhizobium sp. TaxID=376 RepID=UPI0025C3B035|nr:hypothetical protein [Bradyrhizobium sp.]